MDNLTFWAIPLGATLAVMALARWHQRRAAARGLGDLPSTPYFAVPADTAPAGSRNARLVLTTWDLVKRSVAEAVLRDAGIAFTASEFSRYSSDVVRDAPYCQLFVLDEARATEARRILRQTLADPPET